MATVHRSSIARPGPASLVSFCALWLAGLAAPAAGQISPPENSIPPSDVPRTMAAVRLSATQSISLDGAVDEPVWSTAIPATGFVQRDPVEGVAPTERTEVFVLYDDDYLYIGAILYDSDPSGIKAFQKQRDAGLGTDDRFMWVLDTFRDLRTGYFFEINPAGLMGDGLMGAGGFFGVNKSWDGIWEARVKRRPDGWSAEIRIPFRTLNFDPNRDTWGINFQRTVRRKNEEIVWSGYRRNQLLTRPVHAGTLTGLHGMSQGMGLEVKPYVTAGYQFNATTDPAVKPTEYPADAGFDLGYNITPSLRAALTINTDFAEVEVDRRRVNLTRFSLRFPERRDFFLEGSGVFSFASSNGVEPYFSRNIGLANGEPIPITWGTRLGGQTGRQELGFLQIRTGHERRFASDSSFVDIPSEDFTVARVKRTLFEQSSVGLLYTRRATGANETGFSPIDRHTVGADLDLYTSRFLGNKNLQLQAFFVWNSDPVETLATSFWSRTARGARVSYPNDKLRISASYRELDEHHDPAVGFTPRNGFRRFQPTVTVAPRPRGFLGLRQLEFQVRYEHLMDMAWLLETRKTEFKVLGLRFNSGDRVDFDVTQLYERLEPEDAFSLRGVPIPPGQYNTLSWRVSTRTASQRIISGSLNLNGGEFWSGTRTGYGLSVTVRPSPGISLSTRYDRNDVDLADGSFTTKLARISGGWHISPWASLTGNVQYDDGSEIVGLYTRLRWIIRPGNDLYFVYTQNWNNLGERLRDLDFATQSRGATTKINYTHRF